MRKQGTKSLIKANGKLFRSSDGIAKSAKVIPMVDKK